MPEPITPIAAMIGYLDSERKRRQDEDNANIDARIALVHDMISGPGANPARTAEGIQNLLELYGAKGSTKKKPTKGAGGFLGSSEIPMPSLLAGLIHGSIPYEGPTQETVQHPGFENSATDRGLPPQMPGQHLMPRFTGQTVLDEPVPIPPAPLNTPPSGTRMLDAARQMQSTQQLPQARQPIRIAPQELAQREGEAAGIKAGAIADAQKDADIKQMRSVGMSDEEIRQALKRKVTGNTGAMQDADGGIFDVPQPDGTVRQVRAVRRFNPTDGTFQTLDATTGLPIPPNAVPTNVQADGQDPASHKEYALYVKDETTRGNKKILSYNDWLTVDANRKKPTNSTNINVTGASGMTRPQQAAFNQIVGKYTGSPLIKAAARTVTLKANAEAVRKNPADPAAQMALAYSFIQAADTYQSAVREGELKNINSIDSIIGNWWNNVQRINSGQTVRPDIALQVARYTDVMLDAINQGARDAEAVYRSQAAVNGLSSQWEEFIRGAHPAYTGEAHSDDAGFAQFLESLKRKPAGPKP